MTDDFCKVSIMKRFMKCKSLHTNECYVMIGGNKSQKKTADKIHKKFKSGFSLAEINQVLIKSYG